MKTTLGTAKVSAFSRELGVLVGLAAAVLVGCSDAADDTATVDAVTVSPSRQARQGQAQIKVTFERARGGLAAPSRVNLGDLEVAIEPSSTDTRLLLDVTVPHGAPPGLRSLTIEAPSGTITTANVLEVTPITVTGEGKDSDLGTTQLPFRSLQHALSVAGAGDTCLLGAGAYTSVTVETWGYAIPDQLTIRGEAKETTLLLASSPAATAFEPTASLKLEQLTLQDFALAARLQSAHLALQDVAIRGQGKGFVLEGTGSELKLEGGSLEVGDHGIELGDSCTDCSLTIAGTELLASHLLPMIVASSAASGSQLSLAHVHMAGGITVDDAAATLSIDDSNVQGAGTTPLTFSGTTLDIKGSTLTAGTAPYGISLKAGTMMLSDVSVQGNEYCVYQLAGSSKVRNTKLSGYSSIGFYFAAGDLDLGTATEAGNNTFVDSANGAYGLYVNTATSPLTCSNTSFDGVFPPAGVVTNGTNDLLPEPTAYVLTAGTTISFYQIP